MLLALHSSAFADFDANTDLNCSEKAETEYAYQTEVLMHVYELAKVSPKEFEKMRDRLVLIREKELNNCDQKFMAQMEEKVDSQLAAVVSATTNSGSRAPASLSPIARAPASQQQNKAALSKENNRRGAYIEVDGGSAEDGSCMSESDEEQAYTGGRVAIGN